MTFPIFLVEDDPKLRETIGEAINNICDARVVGTAETEAQAIAWLNDHHGAWRLAVLDLFLKSGTGFGVLERLTPRDREQVIVLTNSATAENRNRCLALGALAVYDKTSEFEAFLDHCLRHHQQGPT